MTKTHQLEATLRSLSLSGMLETIDARLAQVKAGELGHVEFLQVLCEDELSRRDAAGIVRRVHAARFEQTCAIEDYDFSYYAASRIMPRRGPNPLCVAGVRHLLSA